MSGPRASRLALVRVKPEKKEEPKVVIFATRWDSMTGLYEYEVYTEDDAVNGVVHPFISSSEKVWDNRVWVAFGKKAIKEGYELIDHLMQQNEEVRQIKNLSSNENF